MSLAIFDLDNTLLAGDSDYLWGRFLVDKGIVDGAAYEEKNRRFYEDYKAGNLDIYKFLAFSLRPLAENDPTVLNALHREFMGQCILPIVAPGATALLAKHRARGDFLLIITATNRFVTAPIAAMLEVDDLLATDPEQVEGRYTGEVSGVPCYKEGKVQRLEQWLRNTQHDLKDSWFYSDSHNDLPLLERVTHPVAVDPDEILADHATARGWETISLRDSGE
ncbi:MAG: HAD family hydrolase [Pseudomonadota bacterium]|nr:MAG: HAD family hydrolase [Pseudomonadota bacterium]